MQVAIAKRALTCEVCCGDECGCWQVDGRTILCVVDGLGHGVLAEGAAEAAVDYVGRHLSQSLPELFAGCDLALRSTRGAAMGIAVVNEQEGTLTYAGIGNTRAAVFRASSAGCSAGTAARLASDWGIVGGGYRSISPEVMALAAGDLVVLCTDGIGGQFDVSGYDDDLRTDVRLLADRVLQDWGRRTDDAAVLAYISEGT